MYEIADFVFALFNGWHLAVWSLVIAAMHFSLSRRESRYKRIPHLMKAVVFLTYAASFVIVELDVFPGEIERAILRLDFFGLLMVSLAYYVPEIIRKSDPLYQRFRREHPGDG